MNEKSRALFSRLGGGTKGDTTDALDLYLKSDPQPGIDDAVTHWYLRYQAAGNEKAPRPVDRAFARMALDFLSIPGASELF